MKRKYRCARTNIGYHICKKKENVDWTMEYWFLWPHNKWILDIAYAKIFYTEDDARDALVLMKIRDGKDTD